MKFHFALAITFLAASFLFAEDKPEKPEAPKKADLTDWQPLFDGKTLNGWKTIPSAGTSGGDGEIGVKDGCLSLGMGVGLTGVVCEKFGKDLPRDNYEIRYEARRVMGTDFFGALTFPFGDSYCSFINGGWGGGTIGLSSIDGFDASENQTGDYRGFKENQWYRFRVRVARPKIQVWMETLQKNETWKEEELIDFDATGKKVALRFEMESYKGLALTTWATTGELRYIEWRKIGEKEEGRGEKEKIKTGCD